MFVHESWETVCPVCGALVILAEEERVGFFRTRCCRRQAYVVCLPSARFLVVEGRRAEITVRRLAK